MRSMQNADEQVARFKADLARGLGVWSLASVAIGVGLRRRGDALWRDVGAQAIGWGLVDGAIALASRLPPRAPISPDREAARLRRILWLNAALDLGYIAAGLHLVSRDGGRWRGHGWGVVVQGAFLLVFDAVQARRVPTGSQSRSKV